MPLKNNNKSYGAIAKSFHWIMALIILGLILVGLYMTELAYSPFKLEVYALHKSFGLLVLWMAGLRILWRLYSKPPQANIPHQKWENFLSKLTHIFLYIAMFGMPLSGWVMSSAGEYPVPFFGISMPDIVPKNMTLASIAHDVHEVLGFVLMAAIGLHVAGAMKHHFIDKDMTLTNMMPSIFTKFGQAVLIIILIIFVAGVFKFLPPKLMSLQAEDAKKTVIVIEQSESKAIDNAWNIVQEQSRINFIGNVYKTDFNASFSNFYGDIIFDPDDLANSKVDIKINLKSVDSQDAERDSEMLGEAWFNVASHPIANFKSIEFQEQSQGKYLVIGNLTLAGKTMPIKFPFTLDIVKGDQGQKAFMNAEFKINRLDYDLGGEEWKSADSVGHNIDVKVILFAEKIF